MKVAYTSFRPRPQQRQIYDNLRRFTVLVCHRRFGKTMFAAETVVRKAAANHRKWPPPRYAVIAPYRHQVKRAAWDYVKHAAGPFLATKPNETDLRVELTGGQRIELFGADNYEALRGSYLDGVVADEYGDVARKAWTEVIRPQLSDYLGWAIILGTPKGRNQFQDVYVNASRGFLEHEDDPESPRTLDPEWAAFMFRASETGIIAPEELKAARRDMSDDEYEQEFECSFVAAIAGAYYAKLLGTAEREFRIKPGLPVSPSALTHTCWDIGHGDDTAIWWFQKIGNEYRWIDFYKSNQEQFSHYAKVLRERAEERELVYGQHFFPPDVEAEFIGQDRTRVEILRSLNIEPTIVDQHRRNDGIEACKVVIPMSYFDEHRCADGIEALRHYRREWVEVRDIFRPEPYHDWASHPADSFRYGVMGRITERWGEFEPLPLPEVQRV